MATDDDGESTRSDAVHIRVMDPCLQQYVWISEVDPIASEQLLLPYAYNAMGDENSGSFQLPDVAVIRIHRRACDVSHPLDVYYSVEGSAANGVDYRELSGVATIPSDKWHVDVIILPFDDNLPEETESVVLTIQPPVCIPIEPPPAECYVVRDPATASAFIRDNDPLPNQLPKIAIESPDHGEAFPAGSNIQIETSAVDPDGWVPQVEFFANGEKIGEQVITFIQEPDPGQEQIFELSWEAVPPGEYFLVAKAIDNQEGMRASEPVKIRVVDPHQVPMVMVFTTDPIGAESSLPQSSEGNPAQFRIFRTCNSSLPLDV